MTEFTEEDRKLLEIAKRNEKELIKLNNEKEVRDIQQQIDDISDKINKAEEKLKSDKAERTELRKLLREAKANKKFKK